MYFQKTMFVANPGPHQQPLAPRFSTARDVSVLHPAMGGTPGPVPSGAHARISEMDISPVPARPGSLGGLVSGLGPVPATPARPGSTSGVLSALGLGTPTFPSGGVSPAPPEHPQRRLHRGGRPVRKPKIHPPHPQSRLARGPG